MGELLKKITGIKIRIVEIVIYIFVLIAGTTALTVIGDRKDVAFILLAFVVMLPVCSIITWRLRNDGKIAAILDRQKRMGESVQKISVRVGKLEKTANKDLERIRADIYALQLALISEDPNGELPTIPPHSMGLKE